VSQVRAVTSKRSKTRCRAWTEVFGDGVEHLSDDEEDGKLELLSTFSALEKLPSKTSKLKVGSLGIYDTLGPYEERVFEFFLGSPTVDA